ncbi:hypothetical protein AB6F62_13365 [Providencia huaxiensis]
MKSLDYSTGYIGKWHLDAPYAPFIESYNNPMEVVIGMNGLLQTAAMALIFYLRLYDLHMKPMYWANIHHGKKPIYVDQWGPEHSGYGYKILTKNKKWAVP